MIRRSGLLFPLFAPSPLAGEGGGEGAIPLHPRCNSPLAMGRIMVGYFYWSLFGAWDLVLGIL